MELSPSSYKLRSAAFLWQLSPSSALGSPKVSENGVHSRDPHPATLVHVASGHRKKRKKLSY